MRETLATTCTVDAPTEADWFDCITQSPDEPAGPEYHVVCTVKADLLAESVNCTAAGCGGHPICRPCFDLAIERGLVVPAGASIGRSEDRPDG